MKPTWFREGIMGEKPDAANLSATHVHLMDLSTAETPDAPDLERIWIAMQGENWSRNGEAIGLITSKGLQHTSMSVGDVIIVDGTTYVAATFGFDKL
jgi:hypothetical protein